MNRNPPPRHWHTAMYFNPLHLHKLTLHWHTAMYLNLEVYASWRTCCRVCRSRSLTSVSLLLWAEGASQGVVRRPPASAAGKTTWSLLVELANSSYAKGFTPAIWQPATSWFVSCCYRGRTMKLLQNPRRERRISLQRAEEPRHSWIKRALYYKCSVFVL